MGEELHQILQNSSNEEYTNKQTNKQKKNSEGNNAGTDKEVDETEGSAFQGKDNGRKKQEAATALCTINQNLSYRSGIEWR